ncbi:hypothetical protein [Bacteroides sp. 51]|uniref:hypothetical protein n=1 Tax=Bacteroides sp. 51 TaxID=2302938 RepID=UPI0013D6C482|nr:hypothetical protein [Bacteroides sp. 51]NDV83916.1 hypothetical protein [Bacteroides sp. 51]
MENIISRFNKSPYFNTFYYFGGKNYEISPTTGKEINIYPILKRRFGERHGRFFPLEENYTELFDISSDIIIPVYYEYALGTHQSETIITFDSLRHALKCDILLESNIEDRKKHHHQFHYSINNETKKHLLPTGDKSFEKEDYLTLHFKGRVINRFPCHSLAFYIHDSNGYCKFDIVFFKDFSKFVRYIATFMIILIMFSIILYTYICLKKFFRQKRYERIKVELENKKDGDMSPTLTEE